MRKKSCIVHGNCQGDALAMLLSASPDFGRAYAISRIVNYENRPLPEGALENCDLLLYQWLGPKWGEHSSAAMLARLPATAGSLCFPNMFFKGYWPFWRKAPGIVNFSDSFLEELLARHIPTSLIMSLYQRCDPELVGDFSENLRRTIAREKDKEEHTPISYVHLIEEEWQKRQLFLTINHPSTFLLLHVANSVLELLGFAPLPKAVCEGFTHPHDEFWLPIHPEIGRRLALPFAQPDRKYNCFSVQLTHKAYTACYLACRENGLSDLVGVLMDLSAHPAIMRRLSA